MDVVGDESGDEPGVTEASVGQAGTDDEPSDPKSAVPRTRWWRRSVNATSRGPRRWTRPAIRGTAVVVVLALLAGAAYEGWLLFEQHQRQVTARQALAAAQTFAENFTNADPSTIDRAIDAISDGSTGEFKQRYVRSISQLRAMLIENKVTTRGTVVRSAIESVTSNQVEVLMFVKQSFTSAAVPQAPPAPGSEAPAGPPTEVVGMEITMEKVNGRWLASKVVPGDKL
ncbi:Mce protein [Mycobacterium sp. pUA109]|uniref:Mce protein n=1 Tax=Mycobacterium sp. pUA109 TaxID=3238982 RepID=UPI00351ADBC2